MASIFEKLKKWLNGTGAAETAVSHQISEADKQEMKALLKASNGYLRVSMNNDKMTVNRIVDDGLRHDGLVYEDNSSGIQVLGRFNLNGKDTGDRTLLYLEDLSPQMQKEIISAAREAFYDQKRNNIIEGGLRVFKDPDYNWEKLTNTDGQTPGQYRKLDSAVKDLNTLAMIQEWKENASSLELSKSDNGEGEKLYVLAGKRKFTPIGTNDSRVEKFVHYFDKSNKEDRKFLNDYFNALHKGDQKAADTVKLNVVKSHFAHAERGAMTRTEGTVSEGHFLSKEARQVNRFNKAHDFQYLKAQGIPFMVMKDRTPTWEGTLNLTSYEHNHINLLPDNLHVKGDLVLQDSTHYYTDDLDHTDTREIQSHLKELPDGLKVDGKIKASEEYLESLKTDRQRDMETITKAILERVKEGSQKNAFTKEERDILLNRFLTEEEPYMAIEDPSTGMSKLDFVRDNNDMKIQELVYTATDLDCEKNKYMVPNVDSSRVPDVIKELEELTRLSDADISRVNSAQAVSSDDGKVAGKGLDGSLNGAGGEKSQAKTGQEPSEEVDVQKTLHDSFEKLLKESPKEGMISRLIDIVNAARAKMGDTINIEPTRIAFGQEEETVMAISFDRFTNPADTPVLVTQDGGVIGFGNDIEAEVDIRKGLKDENAIHALTDAVYTVCIKADLKERVITPSMRSFSDDARQRIRDFAAIASSETLDGIKEAVQEDPEVRREPKQWFTDAVREFSAIVRDEEVNLSAHRGLRI